MRRDYITYKDVGVFNGALTTNIAMGATFGFFNTIAIKFYKRAFLLSMTATSVAISQATLKLVPSFGATVALFGTEENAPMMIRTVNNYDPTMFIEAHQVDLDIMRYVPANTAITFLGSGYLSTSSP